MRKRFISALLAFCMVLLLMPPAPASAQTFTFDIGAEANTVTATYDSDTQIFTISGTGAIKDWEFQTQNTPWYQRYTKEMILEEGITRIGVYTFMTVYGTITRFTSLHIPASVESIGDFSIGHEKLTSVTFAENSRLESIGENAFYGGAFEEIALPANLQTIGMNAFYGCSNLKKIIIPVDTKLNSIGYQPFSGCHTDLTFYYQGTQAQWNALKEKQTILASLENSFHVVIQGGETTCEVSFSANGGSGTMEPITANSNGAFTLPTCGFTPPADKVFGGWLIGEDTYAVGDTYTVAQGTSALTVKAKWIPGGNCGANGSNVTWVIKGKTLTISGTGAMQSYTQSIDIPWRGYTGLDVVIEDGVTQIGDAFATCTLNNVTIAGTVETIPNGAFHDCTVKSVTLQPGVKTIQNLAFQDCTGFTEITIPATVTAIGEQAVHYTGSTSSYPLQTVNFGGTAEQWGNLGVTQENNPVLFAAALKTTEGSTHKVTFAAGGGSGTMPALFVANNGTLTLPANGFTAPAGKHFTGWLINGNTYSANGTYSPVTAPVTVTAQWENNSHKMSFSSNGGSGAMADKTTWANTDYLLPDCAFVPPTGMKFSKWEINGTQYAAGATYPVTGDATAKALWEPKDCTITFVGGAGASGSMNPVTVKGNTSYELPDCGFTMSGKKFYRWQIGDREQSPGDAITVTDSITVTALWKNLYTLTFDPGEGSGSMPEASVAEGEAYSLPDCTFTAPEGKRFQAWQVEGQSYAPGQELAVTKNLTVTALWASSQLITFDAGAGSGSMPDVPYPSSGSYLLPKCEFMPPAGGTFKAWLIDGKEYAPGDPYPLKTGGTVHAVWQMHCTVTLNPNGSGASVGTGSIPVVQGQPYGELPKAVRSGYGFTGWFTAAEGGYLVEADTPVTQGEAHTLYAHWSAVDLENELSYQFSNSAASFHYRLGQDRIPYNIFVNMFGDNALARMYYNILGPWQGSCYGMATSSAILYQDGSGVKPSDFRTGAVRPFDLEVSDANHSLVLTLQDFIEMMMVSQFDYINEHVVTNNLNELWDQVKKVQNGTLAPVEILMRSGRRGHALIGYAAEEVDEKTGRIYVYDSNAPASSCYIELLKDTPTGSYQKWYYDKYFPGGNLSYILYEDFYRVWQNRDMAKQARAAGGDSGKTHTLLVVNSGNLEIFDASGAKAATVVNGELKTENADITQLLVCNSSKAGAAYEHDTAIRLPVGLYTVVNQKESEEKFQAAMVHVDQAAQITTTGDTISFQVNDNDGGTPVNYARLAEPDADYEITLSSSLDNTYTETKLTGTGGNTPVVFAQAGGKLYTDGVDVASSGVTISTRDPQLPGNSSQPAWTPVDKGDVKDLPDTVGSAVTKIHITFEANGGSDSMAPQTATKGTPFILPKCEFTAPSGRTFDGWAMGSLSGEKLQTGDQFKAESDVTLYALWKKTGSSSGGGGGWSGGSGVRPSASPSPKPTASPSPTPSGSPTPTPSPTTPPEPWKNPFPDVSDSGWYMEAVQYVVKEGLMAGYANGKFGPNDDLSRAEFAQIIYNKEGRPSAGGREFTDVKAGKWYANAISWAAEREIVTGVGENQFAPDRSITREELATMLWRYAGSPEPVNTTLNFTDSGKVSGYAAKAVLWANENGIVNGKGNGILDPKGKATRAETAQMLMNYLKK